MNRLMVLLVLFSFLMIAACNEKEPEQENEQIIFVGLKYYDDNGQPIGADANDDGDWLANDTWVDQETELFDIALPMINCPTINTYAINPYPNPCGDVLSLYIQQTGNSVVDLRLVDETLTPVLSMDDVIGNALSINTGALGVKDTFRLYYKFREDDCEYRGHGDILVQ